MKCKDIQDELLLSGTTDQMKEHLSSCVECAEFSKIISGMNGMEIPGPSLELDAKVLDFARNNRPTLKSPIPFYILTALAAMLVVAFSVMMLNSKPGSDNGVVKSGNNEKPVELPVQNELIVENIQENDLNDALDTLWDDELMNADITAIEGELFVLSAELYSN